MGGEEKRTWAGRWGYKELFIIFPFPDRKQNLVDPNASRKKYQANSTSQLPPNRGEIETRKKKNQNLKMLSYFVEQGIN